MTTSQALQHDSFLPAFALETMRAIDLLHHEGLYAQLLTILYSAIDTMAWLDSPEDWASGANFQSWVTQYLLPGSRLRCTAPDLWAARCGVVHTRTARSGGSVGGRAREIWYYGKARSRRVIARAASGRDDVVGVRLVTLVAALSRAVVRYDADLRRAPQRLANANRKARLWLHWVSPAPPPNQRPPQPAGR